MHLSLKEYTRRSTADKGLSNPQGLDYYREHERATRSLTDPSDGICILVLQGAADGGGDGGVYETGETADDGAGTRGGAGTASARHPGFLRCAGGDEVSGARGRGGIREILQHG